MLRLAVDQDFGFLFGHFGLLLLVLRRGVAPVPSPLQLAGEPASFVIGATGLRSPPPACGRGFSGSLRRDAGLGEHVLAVAFGVVHRRGVVAGLGLLAAVEAGPHRVPVAAGRALAVSWEK